tara:strand:- start:51 stop:1418 length:1368 start_codon:yes stop_codon:yes gene_type:complete
VADKPSDKNVIPGLLVQNPSPVGKDSQDRFTKKREQVDRIMDVFLQLLPSNYATQVPGPFYTMQFQAAAEQIAEFQITAQEAFTDGSYEYTRPEFLFQILGLLVFPDAGDDGYPVLHGDLTYRDFLRRMVELLLMGATKKSIEGGLDVLSEATFEVLERSVLGRQTPGTAWLFDDQFTFEVNVTETDDTTGTQKFPFEPFILQENVRIVMRALKPAHTLYDYRHLFTEAFGAFFSGAMSFDWQNYYYEDFRGFCCGAKSITGTAGETLTDRSLFRDSTRDFTSIKVGADLIVSTGPNGIHAGGQEGTTASTDQRHVGRYRVEAVLSFPVGDDATARAFTTDSGLAGEATVSGAVIDATAFGTDFGAALKGEILTFTDGPNAGTYLLKAVLGSTGGLVGAAGVSGTKVRVAPSLLRTERRMEQATTGQTYEVVVDRLGKQVPRPVGGEDVSQFFLL